MVPRPSGELAAHDRRHPARRPRHVVVVRRRHLRGLGHPHGGWLDRPHRPGGSPALAGALADADGRGRHRAVGGADVAGATALVERRIQLRRAG